MKKIILAGNDDRGTACLKVLENVVAVVTNYLASEKLSTEIGWLSIEAGKRNIPVHINMDNLPDVDILICAGYSGILKKDILDKYWCINCHAGKLPEYRGASPMNWALINGETEFTMTIAEMVEGIDEGDILFERIRAIFPYYTIRDLHQIARETFPQMLEAVLSGNYTRRKQEGPPSYYPLRSPEDSLIRFDLMTAEQVHNRIRGLSKGGYCAFAFHNGRKVYFIESEPCDNYYGEPGKIYTGHRVCARDKCLKITRAVYATSHEEFEMPKYERFKEGIEDGIPRPNRRRTSKVCMGAIPHKVG